MLYSTVSYIDPATGNALFYVIIGAFCGVVYFFKDLFYRLFHRSSKSETPGQFSPGTAPATSSVHAIPIAIFSEGKNYWLTYKPIVYALISKRQSFCYYTMDREDPALTIENEYMHSRYIGEGKRAYIKLERIKQPILLTTTPNIGAPDYPLAKPSCVRKMIHVFHSIADMSQYRKHALDAYDAVYMAGEFQRESIITLEKKRGLPPKELYLSGLPYLDALADEMEHINEEKPGSGRESKESPTVLIGSSWGIKGCLVHFGIDFIKRIAETGYQVIIRPHPQSYISEPDLLKKYACDLQKYSNIRWDNAVSPSRSMQESDLMISDVSSIRFDYAFLYKKPVISLEIPPGNMDAYEYADLKENSLLTLNNRIGYSISDPNTPSLPLLIKNAISGFTNDDLEKIRQTTICNFRHSGEAIADELIAESRRLSGNNNTSRH